MEMRFLCAYADEHGDDPDQWDEWVQCQAAADLYEIDSGWLDDALADIYVDPSLLRPVIKALRCGDAVEVGRIVVDVLRRYPLNTFFKQINEHYAQWTADRFADSLSSRADAAYDSYRDELLESQP